MAADRSEDGWQPIGVRPLAAAFKLLKPFHDGANSVLFATPPEPWPPALRTRLLELGKHVARGG